MTRPCLAVLLGLVLFSHLSAAEKDAGKTAPQAVSPDHARKVVIGSELFQKQVRGILTKKCLACHGKDSIEGGLDLSTRDGLMKGGDSGKAIVPGNAKSSLLYKLIAHEQQPRMPYEEEKLTEADIQQIARWIDHEAPYVEPLIASQTRPEARPWTERTIAADARDHWAFRPLVKAVPPSVQGADWCRTPIDRFLLARMEAEGLAPNREVDRRTFIRRASLALIGLPPTADEVDAYVADELPDADERLIDRLLASPHYGERWGRHWLDLARFAESHGFEHDYDRPSAYHYRDFVIRALNDDLPYRDFVRWQIAGDEIAPAENLALMATGFLAAGVHSTQITANEVEKHRYDELDDMLSTTGTAMLGLTIGCARCHDHKFDPIPQADYYRLLATFTTTVRTEVELDFDPEAYRKAKKAFNETHAPFIAARERFEREQLPARLQAWERDRKPDATAKWVLLDLTEPRSKGGATFTRQEDGSLLVSGTNAAHDTYTFRAVTDQSRITGVRLEALSHPSFVKGGPGRAGNGNFALTDFRITAAPVHGKSEPVAVKLRNPIVTFEQVGLPIAATIDDNPRSAWAVDPQFGKDHAAAFEVAEPFGFEGGTVLTITLNFEGNTGHNIGRPRLSITTAGLPLSLEGGTTPSEIVTALSVPAVRRSDAQQQALIQWYRHQDPDWQKLRRAEEEHLATAPKPNLAKVLISSEGLPAVRLHTQGADFFPETYFLRRGDPNLKQGVATAGFLQVLAAPSAGAKPSAPSAPQGSKLSYRRTAFANWMTDLDHGGGALLARVMANRLWQHHFGRGIVPTVSDFGTRGEPPSHPELLEWLAAELAGRNTVNGEAGPTAWSLKRLHRQILLSAAWRQSSASEDSRASIDPDNRLFWRHPVRRLEGETIRDAMLAVSGRLERRFFGPGTLDESMNRRSIYFTMKRSQMVPMMQVFDQPEPLTSVGDRPSTTIAPQALLLLNHPQSRAQAKAFAERLKAGSPSESEQIRNGVLAVLSRLPTNAEQQELTEFLARQRLAHAEAGRAGADERALVDLCQVLFCLNEFVYVE